MSISIPQPFVTSISVAQPFRTKLEGIPDTYSFGVTALPEVDVAVKEIPVLRLSVDNVAPIEIRLTEIPSVRTHIPADFAVSFSMLGLELGAIRLCGEAQVITEPYRPNPCETCGPAVIRPVAVHVVAPATAEVTD
ncbi:MAG TPA: hypothetical protein VLN49_16700 [Gemmatimonadaceae bacterium]|nr:hypothetical protein [Gemmatimonadaceae bacterium]